MTRRIEAIQMRTVLAGLALALLAAVTLFALPDGVGTAEADSLWTKCVRDGAAGVLGVAHDNSRGLVEDCIALLKAKKALQGKDGRKLNWSRKVHMNRWEGVTLSGSPLRVTKIDLSGYYSTDKLKGKIPKQLGNLSSLTYLFLDSNQLSGSIPGKLGNLSNLGRMNLSGNQLTGKIPNQLGRLSNLQWLALYNNRLSGKIPKSFGKLSNLETLIIRNNQLTGSIPAGLAELPKLELLELQFNYLTGCMPTSLSKTRYIKMGSDEGGYVKYRTMGKSREEYYRLTWCD